MYAKPAKRQSRKVITRITPKKPMRKLRDHLFPQELRGYRFGHLEVPIFLLLLTDAIAHWFACITTCGIASNASGAGFDRIIDGFVAEGGQSASASFS